MNEPVSNQVLHPAIADVVPDPSQPRKHFDDEAITRLAVSIKAKGLLQPIRVMLDKKRHMFIILTGESRWRAAKLAGLHACAVSSSSRANCPKRIGLKIASRRTSAEMR